MIYIALFNSPKYGGGVEQVVANLVKNFSDEVKKDMVLICNDLNENENFYFQGIKCINIKTKRFYVLEKIFIASRLLYAWKLFKFCKKNLKDTDTLNIHGIEYAFFISFFSKQLSKFKLIISTHGSWYLSFTDYIIKGLPIKFFIVKFFFFFWRFYFYYIEKISAKRGDYFFHVNNELSAYYSDSHGVDNKKNIVVFNGLYLYSNNEVLCKNDNYFNFCIIGSTYYRKGLNKAEKIIKILYEKGYRVKLNIIGFSDYKGKNNDFINYIGRIPPEHIIGELKNNDIFLFPTIAEGFPVVILEALQCGLPIITSKESHFYDFPNYENLGYMSEKGDIDEYVGLCEKMMNLSAYNSFKKNIGEYDFSIFSWKHITSTYEKIFLNIK